ncbi:phosphatase PAP2 family protein [Pseudoxanthomonas suwonensis]|uniref:phosphatase PAP2 family protein n=1 Tax=Pseudoxanthomonas suwonensis TaxID=314722 RepID=UPI000696DC23|nr:phosphatase PAP2 family protein [Pseudoxanthomonas suwonensis]
MTWNWHLFIAPGSALFVLPLVLALGGLLALREPAARGAVLRWWCAVGLAAALVAASKIAFYGWGTGIRAWDLTCFSGHTVMALAFWPVALALLVPPRRRAWRRTAAGLGWLIGALVGISRVPLGAHPPSEVLAGAALGVAAAVYGLHALRDYRWPRGPTAALGALCLLAALWLWRHPAPTLPSERWFATIGATLADRDSPVDRHQWRTPPPL